MTPSAPLPLPIGLGLDLRRQTSPWDMLQQTRIFAFHATRTDIHSSSQPCLWWSTCASIPSSTALMPQLNRSMQAEGGGQSGQQRPLSVRQPSNGHVRSGKLGRNLQPGCAYCVQSRPSSYGQRGIWKRPWRESLNDHVPSQANWDENHGLRQIQPSLVGAKQAGGRKSC